MRLVEVSGARMRQVEPSQGTTPWLLPPDPGVLPFSLHLEMIAACHFRRSDPMRANTCSAQNRIARRAYPSYSLSAPATSPRVINRSSSSPTAMTGMMAVIASAEIYHHSTPRCVFCAAMKGGSVTAAAFVSISA